MLMLALCYFLSPITLLLRPITSAWESTASMQFRESFLFEVMGN